MRYLLSLSLLTFLLFAQDSDFELGKKIYEQTCISCHAKDGSSDANVKFIVQARALNKTILTQEQTYKVIRDGARHWGAAADIMPSFKYVYSDKDIRSVAFYISESFNKGIEEKIDKLYAQSEAVPEAKKPKMLRRGKKIYNRNCIWCHGKEAKGDGEASRNPELSIFPYDLTKTLLNKKQMFLYVKYGGHYWGADKKDMPSWSRKYNDYTIKSVVKYIEENFRKNNDK
jgi:mono/diheme cytochrome c family protein